MIKGKKAKSRGLPSEAALLEFIQTSPSVVGKREIARAFGLTGAEKIGLKALLRQLEQSGKLAKSRRKLIDTSTLPPVTVIEVTGIDRHGETYGEPVEWDERVAGKAPLVLIEVRNAEGIRPPAKGDRVLAKIEATAGQDYPFKARVIRGLSDRSKRVLGVFRLVKGHGARLIPVDKKARNELQVRSGDENGALEGELVEAEILKDHGRGLPLARVRGRVLAGGQPVASSVELARHLPEGEWRAIFRQLVTRGYLVADIMQWNTLHLTESSRALLKGEEPFLVRKQVRLPKAEKGRKQKGKTDAAPIPSGDQPLWAALKALRAKLAGEGRVPPFVICHDRSLADMVHLKPRSPDELKMVYGMGEAKVAKYGREFLAVVREHRGSKAA